MMTILSFLEQLKQNNTREWFQEHRGSYDTALLQFQGLVNTLIPELRLMDPTLGDIESKQCIFRIYRDIRFSHNKDPYKTQFGAFMARGGRGSQHAGYYLHLEPGASFAGGGIYMPEPPALKAVRDEIYYHTGEFRNILKEPAFVKAFGNLSQEGRLKKPPRGYDPTVEGIDLLMHRHFVVGHSFTDEQVSADDFGQKVLQIFHAMVPLNAFLNRAISMML